MRELWPRMATAAASYARAACGVWSGRRGQGAMSGALQPGTGSGRLCSSQKRSLQGEVMPQRLAGGRGNGCVNGVSRPGSWQQARLHATPPLRGCRRCPASGGWTARGPGSLPPTCPRGAAAGKGGGVGGREGGGQRLDAPEGAHPGPVGPLPGSLGKPSPFPLSSHGPPSAFRWFPRGPASPVAPPGSPTGCWRRWQSAAAR